VYHLARLGHLRRVARHVPEPDEALGAVYAEACAPLVTVLVPSYQEEERVITRTLLSAALQTYARRRVVLLIDDSPRPATASDAARLAAARGLPARIERLLDAPRRRCAGALQAFRHRRAVGALDVRRERTQLADLHAQTADWMDEQARTYPSLDHADRAFVEPTFRALALTHRRRAQHLAAASGEGSAREISVIERSYRRLVAQFDVELTSFERKRYDNLSHEPNKAMNLNSYIALLGGTYREVVRAGTRVLEPAAGADADLRVPDSEFVVAVDADSVIAPDYALRLVHLMRQPGHERTAIAQTPYSAFPGAASAVERIAGATTDIQCLVHQGFSRYDATYWVGANAVIRTAALRDIVAYGVERGTSRRPLHPGPHAHRGHRVDRRPAGQGLEPVQLPRAPGLQRDPGRLRVPPDPAPALGQRGPHHPPLGGVFCGYFVLGHLLRSCGLTEGRRRAALVLLLLLVALTAGGTYWLSLRASRLDASLYDYQAPNVVLMSVLWFLLLKPGAGAHRLAPRLAPGVTWLARASFGLYLVHPIVQELYQGGRLGFGLHGLTAHPALGIPLAAAAIVLTAAVAIVLFRRSVSAAWSLAARVTTALSAARGRRGPVPAPSPGDAAGGAPPRSSARRSRGRECAPRASRHPVSGR
jgi:hypothetical protein